MRQAIGNTSEQADGGVIRPRRRRYVEPQMEQGGGEAPSPDPANLYQAQVQERLGEASLKQQGEYQDWVKQQYADYAPLQKASMQLSMDIATKDAARATEQYDRYKSVFQPVEDGLVTDAANYNSAANKSRIAGVADADVRGAFDSARAESSRSLARMGINPNSGRFAAVNEQMGAQEAATRATAQNNARTQADQIGYQKNLDVVRMGSGTLADSTSSSAAAVSAAGATVGATNQTLATGAAAQTAGRGYTQDALSASNGASGIYSADFRNRTAAYSASSQESGAMWGAVGAIAGYAAIAAMADGGDVTEVVDATGGGGIRGIGTSTSDSIPAKLSDGEFVIPAAVVRRKGIDFFDKLIETHGSPDNKQALAHRRGIRG